MMTDDQLAGVIRERINRCTGSVLDSRMSQERIKVNDYYEGKLPAQLNKGSSRYVSNDVFDSVEAMKAQLLETFCGSFQPIRFLPQSAADVEAARIDTEVCNFVVDRQNDGFRIKQDVIDDGLKNRMGIVKVWWERSQEETEEFFDSPSDDEMTAYMADHPDSDPSEMELAEDGSIRSATFKSTSDTSQVRIEVVPPEEFGISGGARRLTDADMVFHRRQMTPGQLVAMGIKASLIDELPEGHDWLWTDAERFSRAGDADANPFAMERRDQQANKRIEVFECYTKLDLKDSEDGSAGRKLWKVIMAGNKVLDKEQVARLPFHLFVPLPRAHTVWGENYARRIIATQNARTMLTRAIVDHAAVTTNPRWTVLRNGLSDPKELMEGRLGGIVNMTKPDAIGVLPVGPLNPFVYQTIALLDEDKEEVTGISKLSQGLNKDAISKQNSGEMVEQLVNMSQVRQKVIARRFAEFLRDLYMEVNQLVVENAEKEFIISVAGSWVQVDPAAMQIRKHVVIDFSLGYGEKQKEAMKYVAIDKYLSADPRMAQAYDPSRRFTVLSRAIEGWGIKDVETILANPKTLPPPQPDPMHQAQLAEAQAKVALLQAQAQTQVAKVQQDAQREGLKHQIEMAELGLKKLHLMQQFQLEQEKLAHKERVDIAELRAALNAPAPETIITAPKG